MRERRLMLRNKQQGGGIDEHTLLLLHLDGNTTDSSIYNRIPTNTASLRYTTGKFGQALNLQSLKTRIEYDRNLFINLFQSGNYTIEFYSRHLDGWATFCGVDDGTTSGFVCDTQYGYIFQFGIYNDQIITYNASNDGIEKGGWHHFAIVGSGGTVKLFIDGKLKQKKSTKTVVFPNKPFQVGGRENYQGVTNVNYLDEFALYDIAKYDTNFTPPTEPFS